MDQLENFGIARVYGKDAASTPLVRPHPQGFPQFLPRLRTWTRLLALACLILAGHSARADDDAREALTYRLGEGLRLPGTGLGVGGYSTASVDKLQHAPTQAKLDDISLFLWWEGEGRWKFFSEFDYENILSSHDAERDGDEPYLALERIYIDYAFADAAKLRVGKFLTPIGRWNLIHATPLVWTSSRPLVTLQTFPSNVTGLMLSGTLSDLSGTEYALYASSGQEIRTNPDLDPFNEVLGAHLTLPPIGGARIGLSYASFEQKQSRDETKQLYGIDFVWAKNRYEISAEGVYRFSNNGRARDEKGAFVQVVVPLGDKLYAVGRYENFRKALSPSATGLWVTGLNYRITPAFALKAEWIGSRHNSIGAPEGFMSSICVLF
jgi:hypothetical protein